MKFLIHKRFFLYILLIFVFQGTAKAGGNGVWAGAEEITSLPPQQRVVIDTRSSWNFLLGHIPGAINLNDWRDFTQKVNSVRGLLNRDKHWIATELGSLGISPDKTLFIYGDPEDKWRTDGRFFWMFEYYGFKKIKLLKGGIAGWKKSGQPVERGPATSKKHAPFNAQDIVFNPEILADSEWIAARLDSEQITIIDNREQEEYDGRTPYGSPRGGHIPGAIHIDWRDFFDSRGELKSAGDLATLISQYRIPKNREVVVYCTGGVRSGMAYAVFRHLGYRVRNYDGSWWDWSHNPSLPVD